MRVFIGPAGIPLSCKNCDNLKGVEKVAELGLNAMEVEFVRGVTLTNEKAREVGKRARELDVKLSVHAPYFINLCSDDKKKVEASIKRILDSVERARYLKAWIVVVHPGYYGKSKERAEENIRSSLSLLEKKVRRFKSVKVGLETMGRQSQYGTLEEIVEHCKRHSFLHPVVDFAHIYARNGGKIDYKYIFDTLISELGIRKFHTHFTGVKFKQLLEGGNEEKHLTLDEAKGPDFRELAEVLADYEGDIEEITIISESPVLEQDAIKMLEILKEYGVVQ